jgi:hypothetical protein
MGGEWKGGETRAEEKKYLPHSSKENITSVKSGVCLFQTHRVREAGTAKVSLVRESYGEASR